MLESSVTYTPARIGTDLVVAFYNRLLFNFNLFAMEGIIAIIVRYLQMQSGKCFCRLFFRFFYYFPIFAVLFHLYLLKLRCKIRLKPWDWFWEELSVRLGIQINHWICSIVCFRKPWESFRTEDSIDWLKKMNKSSL